MLLSGPITYTMIRIGFHSPVDVYKRQIVDRMHKRVIAIEKGRIVRDEQGVYGFGEDVYKRQ